MLARFDCLVPPLPWCSGKTSASSAADLGSIPAFAVHLFPVIPVIYNIGSPVAILPRVIRFRTGTGWPGVSKLRLAGIAS